MNNHSNTEQNLMEVLKEKGLILKKHEGNVELLKTQENTLNGTILDLQVALGKYHSSNRPMMERGNLSQEESEVENIQSNLKHIHSAAGIVCQLKTCHSTQGFQFPLMKDMLGIVATLGKVDDDNVSSRLSRYLGKESMLAVVCKTLDSVKYAWGFRVICLECLSPYVGDFITNDPQRRLAIQKPRLPDGEIPHGFIDYAVNMIYIDRENLSSVTRDGHGLRETLFYHLFSHVHVYQTRKDMMQAVSLITNGALSLDGGKILGPGHHFLSNMGEPDVKFLKARLTADYSAIEDQIKKAEREKERILNDLRKEQVFLKEAQVTFEAKRVEFLGFLARNSAESSTRFSPVARNRSHRDSR